MNINKTAYLTLCLLAILAIAGCTREKEEKLTAHGYPYIFHIDEEGEVPVEGQYVLYHYMAIIDDSVYNDSHGGIQVPRMAWPKESDVRGNPAPIMDALRMMSPGDSLTVKFSLDSLRKDNPNVPPGEYIEYAITMVDLISPEEYKAYSAAEQEMIRAMRQADKDRAPEIRDQSLKYLQQYKNDALNFERMETPSGVEIYYHKKGKLDTPKPGDAIFTHYYGWIISTEEEFDDSLSKGMPFRFVYKGRMPVIPAWDEAFEFIPRGSIVSMFIPSELGYAEEGFGNRIGPNEDLYFYIEFLERKQ
jgi:FKBP-type peptidyl-prolyl cis-trans isomerase